MHKVSGALVLSVALVALTSQVEANEVAQGIFHLRPSLPAPTVLAGDSSLAVEGAAQMGEADVLSARALYKVTDVLAAFLDVGYYSPDGGADNDVVVQAGVVFEALSFDVANVAVRGAAAYPMADDSDMFLVTGDVVAYRDCEKLEGLRGFVGVGAGYYNWEVDTRFGKFDDSGVELTLSAGADYTILPGLDVGVTLEYVEEPAYSARLRYSF